MQEAIEYGSEDCQFCADYGLNGKCDCDFQSEGNLDHSICLHDLVNNESHNDHPKGKKYCEYLLYNHSRFQDEGQIFNSQRIRS